MNTQEHVITPKNRHGEKGIYIDGKKVHKEQIKYLMAIHQIRQTFGVDHVATTGQVCEVAGSLRGLESLHTLKKRGLVDLKKATRTRNDWWLTPMGSAVLNLHIQMMISGYYDDEK